MDEKQLQFLFESYAKDKGFSDYGEFKSLMGNDASRKTFFEASNKDLGFKDFNEFEGIIGLKKKRCARIWRYFKDFTRRFFARFKLPIIITITIKSVPAKAKKRKAKLR